MSCNSLCGVRSSGSGHICWVCVDRLMVSRRFQVALWTPKVLHIEKISPCCDDERNSLILGEPGFCGVLWCRSNMLLTITTQLMPCHRYAHSCHIDTSSILARRIGTESLDEQVPPGCEASLMLTSAQNPYSRPASCEHAACTSCPRPTTHNKPHNGATPGPNAHHKYH